MKCNMSRNRMNISLFLVCVCVSKSLLQVNKSLGFALLALL